MRRSRGVRRLFQLRSGRAWVERAVDLEIEHHLTLRTEELIEQGIAPDEARRRAERAFGDLSRYRGDCVAEQRREARMTRWKELISGVGMDVRYALRGMRNAPGFTLSVVATLAIGIGANASIFTVVDALILQSIPYEDPDELYRVVAEYNDGQFRLRYFTPEQALRWEDESDVGTPIGLLADVEMLYTDGVEPRTLDGEAIRPGLLALLGSQPLSGRAFVPEDGEPGATPVAIVSHAFWAGELGRRSDAVGGTIRVDDVTMTVVGVMPEDFRSPSTTRTDLWIPLASDGTVGGVEPTWVTMLLRIPEGEQEHVASRVDAFAVGLQADVPGADEWVARLTPLNRPRVTGDTHTALLVVFGAVALMLLIALVNGVNLVFARATTRAKEIAVRLAIGGARSRIAGQIVTESLVLACLSGVAALVLALAGVELVVGLAPASLAALTDGPIGIDGRVLAYVTLVSAAAGLGLGLLPAVQVLRVGRAIEGAGLGLRDGGTRRWHRMRGLLVVSQVALSLVLLFGAGLLGRSFTRLIAVDPGLDPDGLVSLQIGLLEARHPDETARAEYVARVRDGLAGVPGVEGVSIANGLPPRTGITFGTALYGDDLTAPLMDGDVVLPFVSADGEYLRVTGIDLLSGRDFLATDEGARVALVTRALAEVLTPGRSPLGGTFRIDLDGRPWRIVGVIDDVKLMGLDSAYGDLGFIVRGDSDSWRQAATFAVRTAPGGEPALDAIKDAVHTIDPEQPIGRLDTLDEGFAASVAGPRFFLVLIAVFAGLALCLAGIGLYGVLSFAVGQRTREIGIRIALGGGAGRVRSLVLGGGLRLTAAGVLIGIGASLWASRILEGLLFDVSATDAVTLGASAVVMLGVAAIASYLPAHRATRVDPMDVLRSE